MKSLEIMAPAGSFESLAAALKAGADSVYFGVGKLNMRARATVNFTEEDLPQIVQLCRESGAKAYLTLNTLIYNDEIAAAESLCNTALAAGIDAIIAADFAVISYAHRIGLPVHISVQANVCNTASVRFFAQFADVMVLAREMTLKHIQEVIHAIKTENICGPSGEQVRIEIFAHGALCVAVSGKCHMSLSTYNTSANRGACYQNCRRAYRVIDEDTGNELVIDNKYVMSPKDICTIRVLDQLIEAGVSIFKLEGRGRSSDYVWTVTKTYKEAAQAVLQGSFTHKSITQWENTLGSVFNRGFWHGGYYLGEHWNDWSGSSHSRASKKKCHAGKIIKHYAKAEVAEIYLEAEGITLGQELLVTGPTTGVTQFLLTEMRQDKEGEMIAIESAEKGTTVFVKVSEKVRKSDTLFILKERKIIETND